ncbi:MAG: hypothetical protein IPN29_15230 [Saprospiraceae bacterium]|nr:hypothetical protein [Saprospiraceae bacterium]
MRLFYVLAVSFLCIFKLSSQKVGINNADPKTSLDISGAIATRGQLLVANGDTAYIPANLSFVVVTGSAPDTLVIIPPVTDADGLRLVIQNYNTAVCRLTLQSGDFFLVPSASAEIIYAGMSGWTLLHTSQGQSLGQNWSTIGNTAIDVNSKFLGTTDTSTLAFRSNNAERMRLTDEGLKIGNGHKLELGWDVFGKAYNNGTISYTDFGQAQSLDIYGGGMDPGGYDRRITMWAQGGTSFTGGGSFNGSVDVLGEIRPNGNMGLTGQVLTSEGYGAMKWAYPERQGEIMEVSEESADTTALRQMGYQLMGSQIREINKSAFNLGNIADPSNGGLFLGNQCIMFYISAQNKVYCVSVNPSRIFSFDLNEAAYGNIQDFTLPSFNLNNTVPLFTGSKILIYPFFIFDCNTGTTANFPTNPCAGIVVTKAQVWTGSQLVLYGPSGGFTFNPNTNLYTCIETMNGNLYRPGSSATWTGSEVFYYGGYIILPGPDTISADGGVSYNPGTNLWSDIPVGGPRVHQHTAVWTGTELMIIGGRLDESGYVFTNADHLYYPTTLQWNNAHTPALASSLFYTDSETRALLSDGKLFFFKYIDWDAVQRKKLFIKYFDVNTRQWISYTTPYKHQNNAGLCCPVKQTSETLFFTSGNNTCSHASGYAHELGTTTPIYIMPSWNANVFYTAQHVQNGNYVLVFGELGAAWRYQVTQNRWIRTNATGLPTNRTGQVMESISSDRFFVWGGKNGPTYYDNGAIYNASTNTWVSTAGSGAPTARELAQSAFGADKIMIWGGNNGGTIHNGKIYNLLTDTWSSVSATNAPATSGVLEWVGDKFMHVSTAGCKFYFPATNTWIDGNPAARPGVWTGKYMVNTASYYVPAIDSVGNLDKSELNVWENIRFVIKAYDSLNVLFIDEYTGSTPYAEVLNLSNCKINYLPVQQSYHENAAVTADIFKVDSDSYLLFSRMNAVICGGGIDESIHQIQSSGSPIVRPVNVRTLVYRRK